MWRYCCKFWVHCVDVMNGCADDGDDQMSTAHSFPVILSKARDRKNIHIKLQAITYI